MFITDNIYLLRAHGNKQDESYSEPANRLPHNAEVKKKKRHEN